MQESKQFAETSERENSVMLYSSPVTALLLHLTCGLGLASAFWGAHNFSGLTLSENAAPTLQIIWGVEVSVVILVYSIFRNHPEKCSYLKAMTRGLVALPLGAAVIALGAIVLGAPVGIRHLRNTVHWSLLMSVLTFVPAASVFGMSWTDWHRIFALSSPVGSTDFMICLPAHGAVIGAWFGAWPMPLDWERPWQEWPICVTYGALLGYLTGMVLSVGVIFFRNRQQHVKTD